MPDDSAQKFRMMFLPMAAAFKPCCWRPAADVYEVRGGWLLKFELAGVRPSEVEVVIEGRTITVRGVRRDITVEEEQRFYSMEITYQRFERTVTLPDEIENARLATEYRDGLLLVRVLTET